MSDSHRRVVKYWAGYSAITLLCGIVVACILFGVLP